VFCGASPLMTRMTLYQSLLINPAQPVPSAHRQTTISGWCRGINNRIWSRPGASISHRTDCCRVLFERHRGAVSASARIMIPAMFNSVCLHSNQPSYRLAVQTPCSEYSVKPKPDPVKHILQTSEAAVNQSPLVFRAERNN
jgi:hypothetical protein